MKHVLHNMLFIDIETVSATSSLDNLDERLRKSWEKKALWLCRNETVDAAELFEQRAAIFAEYGKIIVIGLGYFLEDGEDQVLRLKAIYNSDEKLLLEEFLRVISRIKTDELQLCAHNGKEFDFPYLCRRLMINQIPLPEILNISGKKPWEIRHSDTMEMWKFGDYKHYTSLELLATLFNIESSKTRMDGSQVGQTYYKENNLEKIADYCLDDVQVTARLFLHLTGKHAGKVRIEITEPNKI